MTLPFTDIEVQAATLARLDTLIAMAARGPGQSVMLPQTYIWTARNQTADWEALTVTLPATPGAGESWVISRLTLHGVCATNPANAAAPIAGLSLVNIGTDVETLEQGQSAIGWNIASRGIPLPAGVVISSTLIPSAVPSYAYVISLTQSTPLVLTPGQTLRGVLSCNPGTTQPGPGAGSWGILTAMGEIHRRAL